MRINRQTASTDGTSTTRIRQFAPALNAAAVATALLAVSSSLNSSAETDRPQVRTLDGFVLWRTGGYTDQARSM